MDWSIKFKQPQRNLYGHSTDATFRFVEANAALCGKLVQQQRFVSASL